MKIIEFLGMPRSGKTTQIKLLANFLRGKKYQVKIISDRERASKIYTPPTEVDGYKLVFFSKALEDFFKNKNLCDYLIIDRGFNDANVWFDVEKNLKHISAYRANQLKNTFQEYAQQVDQIFCLMTKPGIATHRHKKSSHQKVDEVRMSSLYLKALAKAYERNIGKLKNCIVINNNISIKEIHQIIIRKVPLL